jgi:hypothetical protein
MAQPQAQQQTPFAQQATPFAQQQAPFPQQQAPFPQQTPFTQSQAIPAQAIAPTTSSGGRDSSPNPRRASRPSHPQAMQPQPFLSEGVLRIGIIVIAVLIGLVAIGIVVGVVMSSGGDREAAEESSTDVE